MDIPKNLSPSKDRAVYKWPCDGVARFNVAGHAELGKVSYSIAYNVIFHDAGGTLTEGEKPQRVFSQDALRRIKLLNVMYLAQAGHTVRKAVRRQLGAAALLNALSQKPEPESEPSHATNTTGATPG